MLNRTDGEEKLVLPPACSASHIVYIYLIWESSWYHILGAIYQLLQHVV